MAITTIQQATEVTDVGLTTLSEIIRDEPNNVYVRELKTFGAADTVSGIRPLLFTLRMTSGTEAPLQLTAPAQTF